MMHKQETEKRWGLTIALVLFVFAVMVASVFLTGLIFLLLDFTGILSLGMLPHPEVRGSGPFGIVFPMMAVSIIMGTAIAAFFSKRALNPIRKVIDATHRVAEGDFSTRVDIKGIPELVELSFSFNKMTHELSSVETLRRDFINSFSHEFKTPIVSIRGFAKILKENDLEEKEKQEYLEIIITESERLAALSTNVLNLSKYEAIEIIAEKSLYRVDEQIRRAVVMTEPKWSAINLDVDVVLEEITFNGSADLTQQVWLNLIDNAIKFSGMDGILTIRLEHWNNGFRFTIKDSGIGMDEQTVNRIFDKFYQGDASHTKSGNGLGLSIVKRIIDLHGGHIEVQSSLGEGSEFIIWIPTD
jgi:signal transduction histidine kinase